MRILYFYQYFSTPKGSWGTRVYEFGKRWVENGDRVLVVTSVYDKSDLNPSGLVSSMNFDGVEVLVVNVGLSNRHGRFARSLTFLAYSAIASWYAVTKKADVVVASSGPLTTGWLGWLSKIVRRRPFVFEMRDIFSEGAAQLGIVRNPRLQDWLRGMESFLCRQADLVLALSPGIAEWVVARTPGARIEVVSNAADSHLFGQDRLDGSTEKPRELTAVYAGTLGEANNCGLLVDTAGELATRACDVWIEIIGTGKEREELEQRAQQDSAAKIRFRDPIPREDLAAELSRSTMALLVFQPLPVFDTTSPNKLFDALAAGLPVIQTTQGWIKDLLEAEGCGLTVPGDDPDAMADAIVRIADDPALRDEMGVNARHVAVERFDRDLLAEKMRRALHQVVDEAK